jgi:hypothetical protein
MKNQNEYLLDDDLAQARYNLFVLHKFFNLASNETRCRSEILWMRP